MTSSLSTRLQDPASLLAACKDSLPSWSKATLDTFTCTRIRGGYSSPGLYLVTCHLEGATPSRAVVKLEVDQEDRIFYPFFKALETSDGPYQSRIARQVGDAGLGPAVLFLETDQSSPYWGLMIMEELPDGGFDNTNLTKSDVNALGHLFGKLHRLETSDVSQATELARKLVLDEGYMEQAVVEELYHSRGAFSLFWLHWWTKFFPVWMAKNSPHNYPLPQAYFDRLKNLLLRISRIQPRNKMMARIGFSHGDAHSKNLMWKGDKIVTIDFETASTGPAFLDLGGLIWNSKTDNGLQPHLDRYLREELVNSFFFSICEKVDNMDEVLYDLELASLHRRMCFIMYMQFVLVRKPLPHLERMGEVLMGKTEVMVTMMEKAKTDREIFRNIVENGIYWASKPYLTKEQDEIFENPWF